MSILIFIIVLLVLVLVHEFGHFIVAKKSGIRVDEFGFGFPPKIFGKKFGETEYSLNWLPIGGFVKIFGENPDEESISGEDSKRSFVNKPKYIQIAVLFAGVFMNWLLAWVIFSAVSFTGTPYLVSGDMPEGKISDARIMAMVLPNSPVYEAGIRDGNIIDRIESDGNILNLSNLSETGLAPFVLAHNEEEISIFYGEKNNFTEIVVLPQKNVLENNMDKLAIGLGLQEVVTLKMPAHIAIWEGAKETYFFTGAIFNGFIDLFSDLFHGNGDKLSQVSGPVGIV